MMYVYCINRTNCFTTRWEAFRFIILTLDDAIIERTPAYFLSVSSIQLHIDIIYILQNTK